MSNSSLAEARLPGGKECYICGRLHKTGGYLCKECLKVRPFTIIEETEEDSDASMQEM